VSREKKMEEMPGWDAAQLVKETGSERQRQEVKQTGSETHRK
jgi:hypothetical protein